MKVASVFVLSLALLVHEVLSQTAAESNAMKTLGKGYYVYQLGEKVYKCDLDGLGKWTPKLLDNGRSPAISADGKFIAYISIVSSTTGNIIVMNHDGTGKRTLNATPIKHLDRMSWANDLRLIFAAGPKTVRTSTTEFFPQEVWMIDMQGKQTCLLNYTGGSTGSYDYVSFLDLHQNWVTWRWQANVFIGEFGGTAGQISCKVDMGQRCGNTFNPTGDQITMNSVDHKTTTYYKHGDCKTWTSVGNVTFPYKHTSMRWSNKQEWIVVRREEADQDIYAVQTVTDEKIRLSFNNSTTHSPHLYLGEVGSTPVTRTQGLGAQLTVGDGSSRLALQQRVGVEPNVTSVLGIDGRTVAGSRSEEGLRLLPVILRK